MLPGSSPKRDSSPILPPAPVVNSRKRKQPAHNASTPDLAGTAPADDAKPDTHAVLSSRHALSNRPRLTISRHPILTPFIELDGHVYHSTDCPAFNHLGFRYVPAGISPPGSILPCTTIESNPPNFHISWEDRSQAIKVTQDALGLLGDKGYRSARCNTPFREGKWYIEIKLDCAGGIKPPGSTRREGAHVRLGWARREAPLNAPVGVDGYSYAVRDLTGDKVHLSRPRPYCQSFGSGDVIGMYISLPPLRKPDPKDPHDPAHIQRERIAIEVKGQEYFESLEYTVSKEMVALMDGKATSSAVNPDPASSNPTSIIPSSHPNSPSKKSATVKNLPSHPGSKPKIPISTPASASSSKPPLRPLPTLGPTSRIAFFLNGKPQGIAFQDLLSFLPLKPHHEKGKRKNQRDKEREGGPQVHWENKHDDGSTGYYPMISLFNEARVRINPGPHFEFEPPGDIDAVLDGTGDGTTERKWRPACDRYPEYMQEQWALDREEEAAAKAEWERRPAGPEEKEKEKERKMPAKKKAKTAASAAAKKKKGERGSSVIADTKERGSSVFGERPETESAFATPRPGTGSAMDVDDDKFGPNTFTFAPSASTSTLPASSSTHSMHEPPSAPSIYTIPAAPSAYSVPSTYSMPSASSRYTFPSVPSTHVFPPAPSYNIGSGGGISVIAKREEEEEEDEDEDDEDEMKPLNGGGASYGQSGQSRGLGLRTAVWAQKEEEEELPRSSPPIH